MELRHLRAFVTVADTLHFGQAAERLHLAQPALSRTIAQLERELGVQLLVRSTRSVTLTEAGATFLAEAHSLLQHLERATERTRQVGSGEVGHIRLGVTGSASYGYLPRIAAILHRELPGVALSVTTEMLTPAQSDALADGVLDLGLLRAPLGRTDLATAHVESEPLIAALPPRHPLADTGRVRLADLRDERFITYADTTHSVVLDAVVSACARAGFVPHRAHQVQATSTLLALVAAGLGVGVVPESASALRLPGVTFHEVDTDATVDLTLAWHPTQAPASVHALLEALHRNGVLAAPPSVPSHTPIQEAS